MSLTLAKGQKISLQKNGQGLTRVAMGLGWDPVQPEADKPKGGLLGRVFGGSASSTKPAEVDLDASVIVYDENKNVLDTIWFRSLQGMNGAIVHSGDNRTGEGDGDDETISVDLSRLPAQATALVFTVNSFTGQTFNDVENAQCRLVDTTTGAEIAKYTLAEKGAHTGVVMAVVSRPGPSNTDRPWSMQAIGAVAQGRTAQDMGRFCATYA